MANKKLSNDKFDSEDEHFFVMKGRRWRKTDPNIPEGLASELVKALMSARRDVKKAKASEDASLIRLVRSRVQNAKVALGERGHPWWEAQTADTRQIRLEAAFRSLSSIRQSDSPDSAVSPADLAKIIGGEDWADYVEEAKAVAAAMERNSI